MTRRIIKHANRRLYDAQERRVITLLELSDLLADGESVTVELKETGEDITAVTLLASVLERIRRRPDEGLCARLAEELAGAIRGPAEDEERRVELDAGPGDCPPPSATCD